MRTRSSRRTPSRNGSPADAAPPDAVVAECVAVLLHSGHAEEAATVHTVLQRLAPDSPRVPLLAGLLAFAAGRYDEAERNYRGLLRVQPDSGAGRAFLAECLIARRRWREAEAEIEKVRSTASGSDADPEALKLAEQLSAGLESGLFQQAVAAR